MPDLRSPFGEGFTPAHADELAIVMQALACATRLQIVSYLHAHGPLSNVQLESRVGLQQPTIWHSVRRLEAAGLVRSERDGACVPRELNLDALVVLAGLLALAGRRNRKVAKR